MGTTRAYRLEGDPPIAHRARIADRPRVRGDPRMQPDALAGLPPARAAGGGRVGRVQNRRGPVDTAACRGRSTPPGTRTR
ncbi:hypothetical protein PSMK_16550 [Phycisphaera mikurensis NBRC 102666]|uniref:Uncharacterized protein n=1 Tax=Phycisphaera mikurensis (strain NBRC 102666 / KCTC 22515 / FYK2301M01) TaxID=1142394 RepID=I0IEX6_PHYMF|nr:hypothetical protein PSMK_16550 [Phycisphaera mikurensis NBRC 102666]